MSRAGSITSSAANATCHSSVSGWNGWKIATRRCWWRLRAGLKRRPKSRARLRFATEAGGLGIWELDPASRILNGSANFMRIVENTEADALAMVTLMDLVHPDDFYRVRTAFERTIETDADLDTIFRQVRSDGEVRWLHFQARAHRPGNSRPMRLAGIAQDVTDRRRAEQRMELSEEALRLATQAAEGRHLGSGPHDRHPRLVGAARRRCLACRTRSA